MRNTRRSFLGGMAALPACWAAALASEQLAGGQQANEELPPSQRYRRAAAPITSANQVVNVMDFEPLARAALPPAHFGYIATGADDDRTVRLNHDAYAHFGIRAHRFSDLTQLDMTRNVFGVRWTSPLYLSAVSAQGAFHPEAEIATARAAKSRKTQLMLSTGATAAAEDVAQAYGAPYWQQLYPTDDWSVTAAIVKRAERAGASAIALTVDSQGARNNETLERAVREDNRQCTDCHINNNHAMWKGRAMFAGLDVSRVRSLTPPAQTLEYIDRLRAIVKGKLILKGIVTGEDAAAALAHGADGIVVSNHGGRNEETLRATVDCLPEVVAAVRGRIPVFIDGGIRRGTDIFKALAMGATAVGIGRPQVWGLAAFGQSGVEAVIDIYNQELATMMQQAGTPSLERIVGSDIVRSSAT